jgi:hypothetical protein
MRPPARLSFRLLVIPLLISSSIPRSAAAQHPAGMRAGLGAGAEATTTGIVGGTFVYDRGNLHLDALLGARFAHNDSAIAVAARLFFPLHSTQAADFSIGPGLGLVHFEHGDNPPNNARNNEVHLEGAAQIRAFIVSNVALSASAGIGAIFANGDNNNSVVIGGQVAGSFGVTYFFY